MQKAQTFVLFMHQGQDPKTATLTKRNDRRWWESYSAVCSCFSRKTMKNRCRFPAKTAALLCRSTFARVGLFQRERTRTTTSGLGIFLGFALLSQVEPSVAAESTHSQQWFQASGRQLHSTLRPWCCINCDGFGSASRILMQSCSNNRKRNSDQFQSLTVVFWQPKGGFQAALVSKSYVVAQNGWYNLCLI